jgi:hypothetical protein
MSLEKKDDNGFHVRLTPTEKEVIKAVAKLHGTDGSNMIRLLIKPKLDEYMLLAQELVNQGVVGIDRD